jgi:excisionase family DNA binding protein
MTATRKTGPVFYSVSDAAEMLGMCGMTLYRAIRDGQFPAVRIRGRLIIPAAAIEGIAAAAVEAGELVDAASWARTDPPEPSPGRSEVGDRPRPGANQTGAGSPVTQQVVRGDASSMPDDSGEGGITLGRRRASGGTR